MTTENKRLRARIAALETMLAAIERMLLESRKARETSDRPALSPRQQYKIAIGSKVP